MKFLVIYKNQENLDIFLLLEQDSNNIDLSLLKSEAERHAVEHKLSIRAITQVLYPTGDMFYNIWGLRGKGFLSDPEYKKGDLATP